MLPPYHLVMERKEALKQAVALVNGYGANDPLNGDTSQINMVPSPV